MQKYKIVWTAPAKGKDTGIRGGTILKTLKIREDGAIICALPRKKRD